MVDYLFDGFVLGVKRACKVLEMTRLSTYDLFNLLLRLLTDDADTLSASFQFFVDSLLMIFVLL